LILEANGFSNYIVSGGGEPGADPTDEYVMVK